MSLEMVHGTFTTWSKTHQTSFSDHFAGTCLTGWWKQLAQYRDWYFWSLMLEIRNCPVQIKKMSRLRLNSIVRKRMYSFVMSQLYLQYKVLLTCLPLHICLRSHVHINYYKVAMLISKLGNWMSVHMRRTVCNVVSISTIGAGQRTCGQRLC